MDTEDERVNDDIEDEELDDEVQEDDELETQNAPPNPRNTSNSAPRYPIPKRAMSAVEIPMIVMNLDRAEKAFGDISSFRNVSCSLLAGSGPATMRFVRD